MIPNMEVFSIGLIIAWKLVDVLQTEENNHECLNLAARNIVCADSLVGHADVADAPHSGRHPVDDRTRVEARHHDRHRATHARLQAARELRAQGRHDEVQVSGLH